MISLFVPDLFLGVSRLLDFSLVAHRSGARLLSAILVAALLRTGPFSKRHVDHRAFTGFDTTHAHCIE